MNRKRLAAGTFAAFLLVGGGTAAFAYWTTDGSGDGSAATGTGASVTISQLSAPADLRPGGTAQLLTFRINNPQSTNQTVTSVTLAIRNADGTAWSAQADAAKPACTAADFTLTQPTWTPVDLAPGDTDFLGTGAAIQMLNGAGNQDNCKTATVPVHYTAV